MSETDNYSVAAFKEVGISFRLLALCSSFQPHFTQEYSYCHHIPTKISIRRKIMQRLPTLYFELTEMTPSPRFEQRFAHDRTWLPPRPARSNVRNSATVWYRYEDGSTSRLPVEPERPSRQHYRSYSFYCSANRIWIYPSDALRHQVGDGSGNRRILPASPDEDAAHDSSDDPDEDNSRELEDWRALSFTWFVRDGAAISHAATRGYHGSRLGVQWPDQGQIRELLPPRNHADGTRLVLQGNGGMTGEIGILVALIILSLPPDRLDAALRHCLRRNYWPHQQPVGQGCECRHITLTFEVTNYKRGLDRRGLVVSVWFERDRRQAISARTSSADIAAQNIMRFEEGAYLGYGKFVS